MLQSRAHVLEFKEMKGLNFNTIFYHILYSVWDG